MKTEMLKSIRLILVPLILFLCPLAANAEEAEGSAYLSLTATGVDRFLAEHPESDGRGVVIFVLDNGADVGVRGLLKTTTGDPKFVDARDFTGEGDVKLAEATLREDGSLVDQDGEIVLSGVDLLPTKAEKGGYWLGVLEEKRFMNSEFEDSTGSMDINDNGEDDDLFAVLAYPAQGADYWIAFVDTDADGNLDDEEMHRSFADDLKKLYFQRRLPEKQTRPMTFALTILPEDKTVSFHYPDGDHSTHVSGIAAGYRIDGADGFNGVAPGANVVSCKIGDGTLSGGATVTASMKNAYEFVRRYAADRDDEVVIVNMSYGIGSEIEGSSDMDRYIDTLLLENPNIILCTSAGNEGPGISTVGVPAASFMAISVGAVMAEEVARNAYGAEIDGHRLLHFSSRGGELDKPDIVAPGACLSTVPRWSDGSRMWGTSMASPYMAGVMALLVSAAREEFPHRAVNSGLLRRAIQNSADRLEGCTKLGSGRGMVNVPRAWDLLAKILAAEEDPVLAWKISTLSPSAPGAKSRAAYWRSAYCPGDEAQVFEVAPLFVPGASADAKSEFFRSFNLASDADFVRAVQGSIALRQDHSSLVRVVYDPEKLTEPGLYVGRVTGYHGEAAPENRAFDLVNTVVVPHTFGRGNDYTLIKRDVATDPLVPVHYFLDVPAGATRMNVILSVPDGKYSYACAELFDPAGRSYSYLGRLNTTQGVLERAGHIDEGDLEPGVWELVVWGDYRAGKTSYHDLKVEFMGFKVRGAPALSVDFKPGKTPRGSFEVTNLFNKAVWTTATGNVWGYRRTVNKRIENDDEYTYTFSLDESLAGVDFKLEMSAEDYGLFTDFAVNILDSGGKSLLKDGLSYRKTDFFFPNPGGEGTYTLQMIAGFAHASLKPFEFRLEENYVRAEPVPMTVTYTNGSGTILFVPGIASEVKYSLDGVLPMAPKGYETAATLIFAERGTECEVLRVRLSSSP